MNPFNQNPVFTMHLTPFIKITDQQILNQIEQQRQVDALQPKLVVMKGAPYTAKTTVANLLAKALELSLIDLDDVRDCLRSSLPTAYPPSDKRHETLDDFSYHAICETASTMLESHVDVLVDCSLSRKSHYEKMARVATVTGARLVVVECKPRQVYEWKRWAEDRYDETNDRDDDIRWDDFPKPFLKRYDEFELENTSKLVLDTSSYFDEFNLCISLLNLYETKKVYKLDFHQWKAAGGKRLVEQETPNEAYHKVDDNDDEDKDLHHIGHHHKFRLFEGKHDSIICNNCHEEIIDQAYKCTGCKFHLHKPCAESTTNITRSLHDELPFLKPNANQYSFPTTYSCSSNNEFSDRCWSCVFMTFLRCGFFPPVLYHGSHEEHVLQFRINPFFYRYDYVCDACGKGGNHVSYQCEDCNFHIHVNCAFLPSSARKRRYHMHDLSLTYCVPDEESDDEVYCDICEATRNPKNWLYYCEECKVTSHLECATSTV